MGRGRRTKWLYSLWCVLGVLSIKDVRADFTLSSPTTTSISQCSDYATEVLKDPWDFSQRTDLPQSIKPLQYKDLADPMSFASGILQLTTTGTNPYISFLTLQTPGSIAVPEGVRYGTSYPIDSSKYTTASVRMYSDQDSFLQMYWEQAGGKYAITDPVTVYGGMWKTYTVDLPSVGINDHASSGYQWTAGNPVGFRLDPTNKAGSQIMVDWMSLTKSENSCPQVNVTYQGDSSGLATLIVDDNTNPLDGIHQQTLVSTTGNSQTQQFSSARLFSGTYNVYGFSHTDFATLYLNPWDMKQSSDVDSSKIFNLTNPRFEGNKFCATTSNTDGNFYVKFPPGQGIDTSKFKFVTVKIDIAASDVAVSNIAFFDKNGAVKGQVNDMELDTTNNILEYDLSAVSGWSGEIHGLRIQPTTRSGIPFCVDWVSVTPSKPSNLSTEPAIPTVVNAPGAVTITPPSLGSFIQPDMHGGRDCPTGDLGNPWTFNNQSDVQGLSNVSEAKFYPYNAIVDSRGNYRVGDFIGGKATTGDPKIHPILFGSSINADRCTHFCYSLILNRTHEIYHSVARVTYLNNKGEPQDGDDIINPDRWSDSDVCLYMKELQQEPIVPQGTEHPWKGSINFLSLDPHEDDDHAEFFIDYIEIREDHKANTQFVLSVDAPLSKQVKLYASSSRPSLPNALPNDAVLIGTLNAGRNTNTYLWNTANESEGKRYISMEIAGNEVVHAPLWVAIDHSFSDATAPTVMLDAPVNGKKVSNSLQIAGAVFDDIRHAVTEAFIDDTYVQSIVPNLFHKAAREQYPSLTPDKPGFNLFLDISGYSNGVHTLKLLSYDTAGNVRTTEIPFEKGAAADADITYPDANATPVPFTTHPKHLTAQVVNGNNLVLNAEGYEGCSSTAILAGKKSDLSDAITLFNAQGSVTRSASDLSQWVFGGAISSYDYLMSSAAKKKKKCKLVLQCKKKRVKGKMVKVCKKVKVCPKAKPTPKPVPTKIPTAAPTPTPTPAPSLEDGIIYFEARCNGADPSNRVSVNFGTEVSSGNTTIYETVLLQQLQQKLSAQGQ